MFIEIPGERQRIRTRTKEVGTMNQEIRDALEAVLNYNWSDEQTDYEQQDEEGRENHIFLQLQKLSDWKDRN